MEMNKSVQEMMHFVTRCCGMLALRVDSPCITVLALPGTENHLLECNFLLTM
jgi:hypothetical protein